MELLAKSFSLTKTHTPCLVVFYFQQRGLSTLLKTLDDATHGMVKRIQGDLTGDAGNVRLLDGCGELNAKRVLLVGLGKSNDFSIRTWRKVWQAIWTTTKPLALEQLSVQLPAQNTLPATELAQHAAQCLYHHSYQLPVVTQKEAKLPHLNQVMFFAPTPAQRDKLQQALDLGKVIGQASQRARTLGDLPANICTPTYLGDQAQAFADANKHVRAEIFGEDWLLANNMNTLYAVGKGSSEPSRLIVLHYDGAEKTQKPTVLVGKGVTFDTGGISLKSRVAMTGMKYDMLGAATMFSAFCAAVQMGLPINLKLVIASVENMPAGNALKVNDVITTYSGQTVEVFNTDAEGRLILCDALSYCEQFDPKVVVNAATLTGAIVTALGHHRTGVMGNQQKVVDQLLKAANQAHDPAWSLPLDDEFDELLESNIADFNNMGKDAQAGSIVAGCFLSRFTKNYPWAHLDIAGTAFSGRNATGRVVPMMVQFLLNQVT